MHKKALAACVALLAFAASAVVPAMASASPILTDEMGNTVALSSHVTAYSNNLTFENGAKKFTCTNYKLIGSLQVNNGGLIEAEIEQEVTGTKTEFNSGAEGSSCATEGLGAGVRAQFVLKNLPWCLKTFGTDEWKLLGGACGGMAKAVAFEAKLVNGKKEEVGHCSYEMAAVTGTYFTNDTAETTQRLKVTPVNFSRIAGSSIDCPATIKLEGEFKLSQEREVGTTKMVLTPVMIS